MNLGDKVFYNDLTAGTKLPYLLEAIVVDIKIPERPIGMLSSSHRGEKTLLGLKITEDELRRVQFFKGASSMDYDKWTRTQYIDETKVAMYNDAMKQIHDKFWGM
jgi:hypothetical protein